MIQNPLESLTGSSFSVSYLIRAYEKAICETDRQWKFKLKKAHTAALGQLHRQKDGSAVYTGPLIDSGPHIETVGHIQYV